MWIRFLDQEDPLEKEMATHSSILAWRIPWTEEPGGYSPWGGKESDTVSTHAVSRTHSVVVLYVPSLTSEPFAGGEAANFGVLFPSCALGSSQAVSFIVSYTCALLTSRFSMTWFKVISLTPNRG